VTPKAIYKLRKRLGLTQEQFARPLGVHWVLVSKWERGVAAPRPYCAALLRAFQTAVEKKPGIGDVVATALVSEGAIWALYHLLKAAYSK
jgi:predicted transcriptional regulator